MADYSTSLRTQYLEARSHINNVSTEFRLDRNTLYTSNLRLINVGLNRAAADTACTYPPISGILSLFKNVRLMDGSKELSSLRNADKYLAFKNLNQPNEKMQNINDILHKSRGSQELYVDGSVRQSGEGNNGVAILANKSDDLFGYVDLRLILPLLSNIQALDTMVFKNLRLVIEYNSDSRVVTSRDNMTVTINQPTLVADEVVNNDKMAILRKASLGNFVWNEIEHDVFIIPTFVVAHGGLNTYEQVQEVSGVINGFDNKYVSRVLLIKNASDLSKHFGGNVLQDVGAQCSMSQFKEEINIRLQGANLFSGEGLKNDAFKQMLLEETFGPITIPPFGALQSVGLDPEASGSFVNSNGTGLTPDATSARAGIGDYSYIGFSVENKAKSLQIFYKRTGVKDQDAIPETSLGLDMNIYAEVRKSININNGGYVISYV